MNQLSFEEEDDKFKHELKFALQHPDAKLPGRAYNGDAGYDLATIHEADIEPGSIRDLDTGLAVELPAGYWAFIQARSSTMRKYGLFVNPGIIDTGYRGPLYVGVWNPMDRVVHIDKGVKLAQLIPFQNVAGWFRSVATSSLAPSERGTRGFGSSGV